MDAISANSDVHQNNMRRQNALLELANSYTVDSGDFRVAIEEICMASSEALSCCRVSVWIIDDHEGVLSVAALYDRRIGELRPGPTWPQRKVSLLLDILLKESLFTVGDAPNDGLIGEIRESYIAEGKIGSVLGVPITYCGNVIGMLLVENQQIGRRWTTEEQIFARSIAALVARANAASERHNALQEVIELNYELENKVRERTAALSTANDELLDAMGELKKTHKRLAQAEKMSALGELVAGLAHELNNPINFMSTSERVTYEAVSAVRGILDEVLPHDEDGQALRDHLDGHFKSTDESHGHHELGAQRAVSVIKALLSFSHRDEEEHQPCDINLLVDETVTILTGELKGVCVRKELGDLPAFMARPGEFSQVFLNIINNAAYAAKNSKLPREPVVQIKTTKSDEQIEISIADNGKGIDADVSKSLFDPFVTTKPVGTGTGMGLSISYQLVANYGGEIVVDSTPSGAVFTIRLPCEH